MTVIVLVVWVLAVARATRLINADTLLDPPRLWVATRAVQARADANESRDLGQAVRHVRLDTIASRWEKFLAFIQCPWCVGMWVALASAWAPMLLLSWFDRPWWLDAVVYLALVLAASHMVGVLARFADTEEIAFEDDDDS
ncbi:membrane protein [Mycobacterium phage Knocker]|nr:membrane protein [Mycobacterium phage Knocker]